VSYGKNLLTLKVALKFINNFLDSEIAKHTSCWKSGNANYYQSPGGRKLESSIAVGSQIVKLKGKQIVLILLEALPELLITKQG